MNNAPSPVANSPGKSGSNWLGPQVPGLLGGKGSRAPVEGVRVLFVPVDGSDLAVLPAETISDAGGLAATKVRAGRKTGDQYLKIIPVGSKAKASRSV